MPNSMLSLNVTPPTLSYEGLDRVLAFQAYLSPSVTRKRTRHTLPTSFVSAVVRKDLGPVARGGTFSHTAVE